MMNATRIFPRHNIISNLTMIVWNMCDSSNSNICTPAHSSAKPCLVAKDPKQITCQLPVCTTCTAARMCKRPHGANHSQPDAELENILRSGNLKPGSIISVDQYESSVRGQLPLTRGQETLSRKYIAGVHYFTITLWHNLWFVIKFLWLHQTPSSLFSL